MSQIETMLNMHPGQPAIERAALVRMLGALMECAQTCIACADACLAEPHVDELRRCIRLNLDCADVCDATRRCLMRQTEADWTLLRSAVDTCVIACQLCGEACRHHAARHDHCRLCADVCRGCEDACNWSLRAIAGRG